MLDLFLDFTARDWSYIVGVINAFVWILVFIYFRIKRPCWGLTHIILLLYTSIAVVSFHLFLYYPYASQMFNELKLFPYVYLFVMLMLGLYPILALERKKIYIIQRPRKMLFYSVCSVLVLLSLYKIEDLFLDIGDGLLMLFVDSDAGKEAYNKGAAIFTTDTSSGDLSKQIDYMAVLANLSRTIIPVLWLYYFSESKRNNFLFYTLTICMLFFPLNAIASGSRHALIVFGLALIAGFFIIKNTLTYHMIRMAKKLLLFLTVILLIPFVLVSMSRSSGDMEYTLYGMERYFAESFIRFNNHGLDANGIRNADRTMTLFKNVVGLETAKNYPERIYKYRNMTIDESLYISYVGDFTLDFGPIVSFIIFLFFSLFFRKRLFVRNGVLLFHQYVLLYILMKVNLGFFLYLFPDTFGNAELIALIILYLLFKIDYNMKRCFIYN